MKLVPLDLIPFLIDSDLHARVGALSIQRGIDGLPDAEILREVQFLGGGVPADRYMQARDYLLSLPSSEGSDLLDLAASGLGELWGEEWRLSTVNGSPDLDAHLASCGREREVLAEYLENDALLRRGDRDLSPRGVAVGLMAGLHRGVGSPAWWRARSVAELADRGVLADVIGGASMGISARALVMLLYPARRVSGEGAWWRELFPMPDASGFFDRAGARRAERRVRSISYKASGVGADRDALGRSLRE